MATHRRPPDLDIVKEIGDACIRLLTTSHGTHRLFDLVYLSRRVTQISSPEAFENALRHLPGHYAARLIGRTGRRSRPRLNKGGKIV